MKHGEQLAPLIAAVLADAGIVRQDLTASRSASGPARSPACASGWSPRAPWPSSSRSRCTACARSTCSRRGAGRRRGRLRLPVATDARRKEVYWRRTTTRGAGSTARRSSGPPTWPPTAGGRGGGGCSTRTRSPTPSTGPARRRLAARAVAEELVELYDPEPMYLRRPDAVAPGAPKRVS